MAHHGDEHVDKHDDDGDVVEREQEHADSFHHRRRRVAEREARRELAAVFLGRVLDLDAADRCHADGYSNTLPCSLDGYLISMLLTATSPNIDQNRLNSVRGNLRIKEMNK